MKLYLFLFRISILFSVLWGAHAWFTWWVDTTAYGTPICIILLAIISIWYKIKQKIKFKRHFESVRRTRQKIQETHPELGCLPEYRRNRKKMQKLYTDYARK